MAEDHVFYKRFNFQSIAMEEYEVRDVARRHDTPDLSISLTIDGAQSTKLKFAEGSEYSDPVTVNLGINNQSPTPAMYVVVTLHFDQGLRVSDPSEFSSNGQSYLKVGGDEFQTNVFTLNWAAPGKMPIWEGVSFRITRDPVLLAVPKGERGYFLVCEVHSPLMTPRKEIRILNVTNDGEAALLRLKA